jgi:hypothetical protein
VGDAVASSKLRTKRVGAIAGVSSDGGSIPPASIQFAVCFRTVLNEQPERFRPNRIDESEVSGDPRFLCVREGLTLPGPSQEEARLRCLEFVGGLWELSLR